MVANASRPPTQPVNGSFAITVAVRGASRSKAISPTIRPGSNSATVSCPSTPVCVDLGASGSDEQKGHGEFALLHEHLARRRGQRPQLRRQWHESLGGAAGEDLQCGEFVGADDSQAGHVTRLRCAIATSKERGAGP